MIVLGVESSCDETSVSLSRDGKTILSNVVLSQIDLHKAFGGVVPEIASREHIKGVTVVFEQALDEAQLTASDVDLVAVTQGPGLIGSLLIGINAAKAFAFANDIPIIGVHHIAGHIYANQIESNMVFPLLCLVVSGGHTELILMRGHYQFEKLGETMDDAIGEAYDKVARVLGLPYPGGPAIDRISDQGQSSYPMPNIQVDGFNFSYSGLKSHVINLVNTLRMKKEPIDVASMAKSFQEAAVAHVMDKSIQAFQAYDVKMFMIAGGVAANRLLRQRVEETFGDGLLSIPAFKYCTDNAAMMSIAGYYQFQQHKNTATMTLNGYSRLNL